MHLAGPVDTYTSPSSRPAPCDPAGGSVRVTWPAGTRREARGPSVDLQPEACRGRWPAVVGSSPDHVGDRDLGLPLDTDQVDRRSLGAAAFRRAGFGADHLAGWGPCWRWRWVGLTTKPGRLEGGWRRGRGWPATLGTGDLGRPAADQEDQRTCRWPVGPRLRLGVETLPTAAALVWLRVVTLVKPSSAARSGGGRRWSCRRGRSGR